MTVDAQNPKIIPLYNQRETFEKIVESLDRVTRTDSDHIKARCPCHDDNKPSLYVSFEKNKTLWNCRAGCTQDQLTNYFISKGLWHSPAAKIKSWKCEGGNGQVYYHYRKYPGKKMWWKPTGAKPKNLLYITGKRDSETSIITEGEKAADAVSAAFPDYRVIATVCGASSCPTKTVFNDFLNGCQEVTLWPDADAAGVNHMLAVSRALPSGVQVKWIETADLKDKQDAADLSIENRKKRIETATTTTPEPPPEPESPTKEVSQNALTKDFYGFEEALKRLNVECRYNVRETKLEICAGKGWESLTDIERKHIEVQIELNFENFKGERLVFSERSFNKYLCEMGIRKKVDPFLLWLESLPPWDDERRVEYLLYHLFILPEDTESDYMETDRGVLVEWASKYLFLGSIQRAYQPGCRLKQIPILIGQQGIGKSPLLESLFPRDFQSDWFTDSLSFRTTPQQRIENTIGPVVVEWNELEGATKAELSTMKAYISTTHDKIRLAYRQDAETIARRFVMVGTTNEATPLPNDPTGNDRYVPIQLNHGASVESYLDKHRDQLWAEALAMYRNGETAEFPKEHIGYRNIVNKEYRQRDDLLESAIESLPNNSYKLEELVKQTGIYEGQPQALPRRELTRLKIALQTCGWQYKKTAKNRLWVKK